MVSATVSFPTDTQTTVAVGLSSPVSLRTEELPHRENSVPLRFEFFYSPFQFRQFIFLTSARSTADERDSADEHRDGHEQEDEENEPRFRDIR